MAGKGVLTADPRLAQVLSTHIARDNTVWPHTLFRFAQDLRSVFFRSIWHLNEPGQRVFVKAQAMRIVDPNFLFNGAWTPRRSPSVACLW